MKPESWTSCWIISTLGFGCSAGHCRILARSSGLAPRPTHIRAPQVNFTDNVKSWRDIVINRSILINGQHRFWLLCLYIANMKFMNVFVRASTKSHNPGSCIRKSGCRLENCRAYICAACISTPNHISLTLYDIINFNDITPALSSYDYGRNITFVDV